MTNNLTSEYVVASLDRQLGEAIMSHSGELIAQRHWFGYGRWTAPYWFIGAEQGGSEEGLEHGANAAWLRLGGGELLDCQRHHREFGYHTWHGDRPNLQPTWRRLILLLLAFLDLPRDQDSLRAYQRDKWGRENGDTALLELSGARARSLVTPANRTSFLPERIGRLRENVKRTNPIFVVCYCKARKRDYEQIIGRPFGEDGYAIEQRTLFVLRSTAASTGNDLDWERKGREMKEKCLELQAAR